MPTILQNITNAVKNVQNGTVSLGLTILGIVSIIALIVCVIFIVVHLVFKKDFKAARGWILRALVVAVVAFAGVVYTVDAAKTATGNSGSPTTALNNLQNNQ